MDELNKLLTNNYLKNDLNNILNHNNGVFVDETKLKNSIDSIDSFFHEIIRTHTHLKKYSIIKKQFEKLKKEKEL